MGTCKKFSLAYTVFFSLCLSSLRLDYALSEPMAKGSKIERNHRQKSIAQESHDKNGSFVKKTSLEEALAQAYDHNYKLQMGRSHVKSADASVQTAKAGFLPKITLEGSASRLNISGNQARLNQNNAEIFSDYTLITSPRSAEVKIHQSIFDGGKTLGAVRMAKLKKDQARASLLANEQDVFLNALKVYIQIIHNEKLLQLHENYVKIIEEEHKHTQTRTAAQEATLTDVAYTATALAEAQMLASQAQASLMASRPAYREVIGTNPEYLMAPKDISHQLPESLDNALTKTLSRHPEIEAAKYGLQASFQEEVIAKSELAPSVSVSASFGHQRDVQFPNDHRNTMNVTGRLSIPLYDGGLGQGTIKQAREKITQSRLGLQATRDHIQTQTITAWAHYEAAKRNLESMKTQITASMQALEGTKQEFSVGNKTILDVLNAKKNFFQTEIAALSTHTNYIIAIYTLLSITGDFNFRTLTANVS